jgi:hypothetical protein
VGNRSIDRLAPASCTGPNGRELAGAVSDGGAHALAALLCGLRLPLLLDVAKRSHGALVKGSAGRALDRARHEGVGHVCTR